ncbi:hypothetical protein HY837_04930 [archaeon]|nr:hypothetical protein [archaeon]
MKKYYLIGESHGTKECPEICLDLIHHEDIWQLALEFGYNLQYELDEYLNDERNVEDLTIFKNPFDTRASEAMKDLIVTAKDCEMMIYFVDDYKNSTDGDKIIAENLKKIDGKVAFFCGAAHASKKPLRFDPDSIRYHRFKNGVMETCGSLLPLEETVSYDIRSVNGGHVWDQRIKEVTGNPKLSEKYKKLPLLLKVNTPKYDYFYLVDKFTPSVNLYKLRNP